MTAMRAPMARVYVSFELFGLPRVGPGRYFVGWAGSSRGAI